MRSPTTHRAPAAGLLLLALTLTACSSPTPSRPQDRTTPAAGDASSDTSNAPAAGSGFRTDPISGGEAVWDEMYGTEAPPESESPDQPYPRPSEEPLIDDSPYPGPGTATGDDEPTPTAVATKSGG